MKIERCMSNDIPFYIFTFDSTEHTPFLIAIFGKGSHSLKFLVVVRVTQAILATYKE